MPVIFGAVARESRRVELLPLPQPTTVTKRGLGDPRRDARRSGSRASLPWGVFGACMLAGCSTRFDVLGPDASTRDAASESRTSEPATAIDAGPDRSDTLSTERATADAELGASSGTDDWEEPPYAHVTAVLVSGTSGAYQFDVSIESADTGCSLYADWWEVVTLAGDLVYRRVLTHSHTDKNGTTDEGAPGNTFTRGGGPVPVSGDERLVVRAHLNTGGYNGRAMRGSANAGFESFSLDGGFALDVERLPPQPTGCSF